MFVTKLTKWMLTEEIVQPEDSQIFMVARFLTDIVFKQSLLGDEDALSLATMDDNDPDGSLDEFGSGYRGFSAQSSAIRDVKMILLKFF